MYISEREINLANTGKCKGEKIIREYSMNNNENNSDKKLKMKRGHSKRSYSLNDFENQKNQSEFVIRKQNSRNRNAQFSIRRTDQHYTTEEAIPKYYTSPSVAPSTSPIVFQKKYNSYNEKLSKYPLKNVYSDDEVLSSERLFKMEKNSNFHNLKLKNEWNDETKEKDNKKSQESFLIENKGINIGDSLINDDAFTPYIISDDMEKETESNTNIILDIYLTNNENQEDNQTSIISRSGYSINSDDTYDRLFLLNEIKENTSNDSIKVKQTKKSFKQKVMRHFSRSSSRKISSKYQYIEWENLPLEIVFNIFSDFSIEELAYLRGV
ncbi:hypothetical protein PIROE2DRAFT_18785 [Piromyces sp. E2]|nr:hypothetical protein PIROE2DRAFT_18785 [Piromyces sp. E2]|eukprot:OUM56557.1 hypothetical protein PIROE2DRAFT_18785 [Piromyces sp. E2]